SDSWLRSGDGSLIRSSPAWFVAWSARRADHTTAGAKSLGGRTNAGTGELRRVRMLDGQLTPGLLRLLSAAALLVAVGSLLGARRDRWSAHEAGLALALFAL